MKPDYISVPDWELLLKKYHSLTKMKEAEIEELEQILPHEVAINLYNYLKEYK